MLGLSKPQISSAAEPRPETSKYHSLLKGTRILGEMANTRVAAGKLQRDLGVSWQKTVLREWQELVKRTTSHLEVASTDQI